MKVPLLIPTIITVKHMYIESLIAVTLLVLTASHCYQTFMMYGQVTKRPELPKVNETEKRIEVKERMIPLHIVKKLEEEKEPDKFVEPLATLQFDQMTFDDKRALNEALAEDDNNF